MCNFVTEHTKRQYLCHVAFFAPKPFGGILASAAGLNRQSRSQGRSAGVGPKNAGGPGNEVDQHNINAIYRRVRFYLHRWTELTSGNPLEFASKVPCARGQLRQHFISQGGYGAKVDYLPCNVLELRKALQSDVKLYYFLAVQNPSKTRALMGC